MDISGVLTEKELSERAGEIVEYALLREDWGVLMGLMVPLEKEGGLRLEGIVGNPAGVRVIMSSDNRRYVKLKDGLWYEYIQTAQNKSDV